MSYDLKGRAPAAPEGKALSLNGWTWRPLVGIVRTCFLNVGWNLEPLEDWGHNSGHGLPQPERCELLAAELEAFAGELPDEFALPNALGHISTAYGCTVGDVRRLARFLKACGGFGVH